MRAKSRFASGWMFFAIVAVLVGWVSAFPALANAQGGQGHLHTPPTYEIHSGMGNSADAVPLPLYLSWFPGPQVTVVAGHRRGMTG